MKISILGMGILATALVAYSDVGQGVSNPSSFQTTPGLNQAPGTLGDDTQIPDSPSPPPENDFSFDNLNSDRFDPGSEYPGPRQLPGQAAPESNFDLRDNMNRSRQFGPNAPGTFNPPGSSNTTPGTPNNTFGTGGIPLGSPNNGS